MFNLTGLFVVDAKNRNSSASYVNGVQVGDIIRMSVKFKRASALSYSKDVTHIEIEKYINGDYFDDESYEYIGQAGQNEIFRGYRTIDEEVKHYDTEPVFIVTQLKASDLR